ncbi:hypothetical protein mRhiFer1_009483 [Rhinolophus ferrumequinum]|uniref:Uncharacterized protein n=1 Tax=Rhinolophus ferrumequinum TaxID=59479 RepID=A0A7J7REV8_RHIFE|nr:hypothetical protein mRhiFer1_009483 [Rhinolophus ferrumequinum]
MLSAQLPNDLDTAFPCIIIAPPKSLQRPCNGRESQGAVLCSPYFVPPSLEPRGFSVDLRRSSYLIGPEDRPLGSLALLRKELLWKAISGYTDILAHSCLYDLVFSPHVPISLNRRQRTQPSVSFCGAVPTCS